MAPQHNLLQYSLGENEKFIIPEYLTDTDEDVDQLSVKVGIHTLDALPISVHAYSEEPADIYMHGPAPPRLNLQRQGIAAPVGKKVNVRDVTGKSGRDDIAASQFGHNQSFSDLAGELGGEATLSHGPCCSASPPQFLSRLTTD